MRNALHSALALLAAGFMGCQVAPEETTEVGTQQQALCDTNTGAYPVLATLAMAMGVEVGRFQPLTDLVARDANGNALSGNWGSAVSVELTAAAIARCNARNVPGCPVSEDLLSLQDGEQTAYPDFDWEHFNATNYFWALVSGFDRQASHEADLAMNRPHLLAGQHELYFLGNSDQGGCDFHTEFQANGQNVTHLDSKLVFFGGTQNPYVDFRASDSKVAIDPDSYLGSPYSSTNSPVCYNTCTVYNPALLGECCSCDGRWGNVRASEARHFRLQVSGRGHA